MRNLIRKLFDFLFPREDMEKTLHELSPSAWREKTRGTAPLPDPLHTCTDYHDPLVKKTVWALKYKRNPDALRIVGALLYEELLGVLGDTLSSFEERTVLVVPIPLSSRRKRARGYNQAALIAENLCTYDENNILVFAPDVLIRTRHTPPQTGQRRTERLANMIGVFAVQDVANVQNKTIVLIDDVITTGATMQDALRALREVGAHDVYGLALAH